MLEEIPIYRMVLQPRSFQINDNSKAKIIDLICELPNTENVHRKKELSTIPIEKHKSYYQARLILETKRFVREMLYNCSIASDEYETILQGGDLEKLISLIEKYRVSFFKYLILKDIEQYRLFRGYMKQEIIQSNTIEEVQTHVKKYGLMSKLFLQLNTDYQKLKAIFC